jgi:hypothetical protein
VKLDLNLYENGKDILVDKSQDVKHIHRGLIGIVVTFAGAFKEYGSFFIGLRKGCICI